MWWSARLAALMTITAPWQCPANGWIDTVPPPGPTASTTPTPTTKAPDHTPSRVTTSPPPKVPERRITLPDQVVVRALDAVKPSFVRCFVRARTADPSLGPLKVTLHLEIDPDGVVSRVTTNTDITKLNNCLAAVARMMKFAAPAEPATVDVPLLY